MPSPHSRPRPRPSPRFSQRRRARASRSTPCGCAMPHCAICTCWPAIHRQPHRRWLAPRLPASAAPIAGLCEKDRPGARPVAHCGPGDPRHPARAAGSRLILVGFAAALRPSELARLAVASLTRHEDGIALFLPWRKNDQEAQGTTVWLPAGCTDLCPVRALEAWLAAAGISEGPLFRRLWRLPPPRVPKGEPNADRRRATGWGPTRSIPIRSRSSSRNGPAGRARRRRLCRP